MSPASVMGIRRACRRAARAAGAGDTDGVRAALEAACALVGMPTSVPADVLAWAMYILSSGPCAPVELAAVARCGVPVARAVLVVARGGR